MKARHNLRKLKVWNDAVDLAVDIYRATENFPREEKFGLVSQMNRSAVSIPSNIAEGAGRNTAGEFIQFLGIANGSGNELFTQLVISNRLNFINDETMEVLEDKIDKVQRSMYNIGKTIETQKK
ncbi:MAG: four helix bundle protein [Bacteroidetes bacterium]|nr:four helix bundle protein [Bacteroidota bacterium]